jgi:hypothetical protein
VSGDRGPEPERPEPERPEPELIEDPDPHVDLPPPEEVSSRASREVGDGSRPAALTFHRLRDLVERCASVHRTMGETLQERSREATEEKERLLLLTIGETEVELADELTEAFTRVHEEQRHGRHGDETWIQSTPSSPFFDAVERCERLATLPPAELDHEARSASRSLTRFFEELLAAAPNETQQELIEGLCRIEASFDRRHSTTVDASLV